MERNYPDHIRPATAAPGTAVSSFPLVKAMKAALIEPEVKDFIKCQPAYLKTGARPSFLSINAAAASLRAPGGQAPAGSPSKEDKKVKKKEKKAKAKAKAKAAAKRLAKLERQVAKGGGKGGGGGAAASPPAAAGADREPKIPRGLLPNGRAKANDGTSFCFGYNLGTCTCADVQPGQKCPKGMHKCCHMGCSTNHPMKGNH